MKITTKTTTKCLFSLHIFYIFFLHAIFLHICPVIRSFFVLNTLNLYYRFCESIRISKMCTGYRIRYVLYNVDSCCTVLYIAGFLLTFSYTNQQITFLLYIYRIQYILQIYNIHIIRATLLLYAVHLKA